MTIHIGDLRVRQGEACLLVQEFTHRHFIISIETAIRMQPLATKLHAAL